MDTAITRCAHATWCKLGDQAAILDRSEGVYFKLNQSGTVIWEALDQPAYSTQLVGALVSRFGISEAQALKDVTAFVDNLKQLNLVEEAAF